MRAEAMERTWRTGEHGHDHANGETEGEMSTRLHTGQICSVGPSYAAAGIADAVVPGPLLLLGFQSGLRGKVKGEVNADAR